MSGKAIRILNRVYALLWAGAALGLLSACETPGPGEGADPGVDAPYTAPPIPSTALPPQGLSTDISAQLSKQDTAAAEPTIFAGSGVFTGEPGTHYRKAPEAKDEGQLTLNFQNTDVREVIQTVLGDLLEENFVLDPGVGGSVSITTGRPLPRSQLLPVFEELLRMNGIALVRDNGLIKVVPEAKAVKGELRPSFNLPTVRPGYTVRIVPLRYISALEMQKLLEPFSNPENILRADNNRNLLMLAGSPKLLARLQETIDIFDVDWLSGMSVALYPVQNTDPGTIVSDLDVLLGPTAETPIAGLFKFLPIDRLNSIMVITPQAEYLRHAKVWIDRLDAGGGSTSTDQKLYVYQVQHGKADHLAGLLQDVFGTSGGSSRSSTSSARTAPNRTQTQVSSSGDSSRSGSSSSSSSTTDSNRIRARNTPRSASRSSDNSGLDDDNTKVIADEENNALLILASPRDYRIIEATLKRLDVPRRQVLIEATIAEVSLTGNLEYGLQWFFKNNGLNLFGTDFNGTGAVSGVSEGFLIGTTDSLARGQGFNYTLSDPTGTVRAALQALASDSKVRILSAPHLMVLDNETGSIRVGNEQPVFTSTTQNINVSDGTTNNAIATNQIQFKDTGVTLDVTPHINAGGQVTLELTQDVTDVGEVDTATGQRTFLQRNISSVISVLSGESVVLGGLIRDNQTVGKGGVPGLYKLPVIGALFGNNTKTAVRTELVVLITPRIVRDNSESRQVTKEMRQRMRNAFDIYDEELPVTRRLQ